MNETLSYYLSVTEFNQILKYWKNINKIKEKINYNCRLYHKYEDTFDDEETIEKFNKFNDRLDAILEKWRGTLRDYERSYEEYVNRLGYKLNDPTQDEVLFNLLTNGVILDT